jgi:ABC-2 type transport system ATP-binding protein
MRTVEEIELQAEGPAEKKDIHMTTPAIQVTRLLKKYGDFTAVNGIDLQVNHGQLFGFLGPNGAGKSTTIGCLTGLLDPTSGTIRLLGRDFTADSSDVKRRIGVMPEGGALFEQLYATEFLSFQARMFEVQSEAAKQRIGQLLETLELPAQNKRIAEFSTGMKKKVAFAAAILHSPDILFLDEPFESIDPAGVAMMKGWLRDFIKQGKTVFLTSHVLETVEKLCDEVAIMVSGRIAWSGGLRASAEGNFSFNHQGRCFRTLEELFLSLTGQKSQNLSWL